MYKRLPGYICASTLDLLTVHVVILSDVDLYFDFYLFQLSSAMLQKQRLLRFPENQKKRQHHNTRRILVGFSSAVLAILS